MEHYRTWLFSPADAPDRCLKALNSDADQVIWDLEDGVGAGNKASAQLNLIKLLKQIPRTRTPWIRINGLDDISAITAVIPHPRWVVPKVEQTFLTQLQDLTTPPHAKQEWLFIIESARGLWDLLHSPIPWQRGADAIRLAFGSLDYLNDIGGRSTREETELVGARTALPWISRAWNWPAPIDSVYPVIDDITTLAALTRRSQAFGFAGRMIIHPRQIAPVNQSFLPSEEERQWAQAILGGASSHRGVVRINGEMVDKPVVERARRISDLAAQYTALKQPQK